MPARDADHGPLPGHHVVVDIFGLPALERVGLPRLVLEVAPVIGRVGL